jgi:hypothetical protein
MRVRAMSILAACAAATAATGTAHAGGAPSKVVVVGAGGRSRVVRVTTAQGNALYTGRSRPAPHGGYLRIFPLFGGLPGIAGRFYPGAGVVCLDSPDAPCRTAARSIRPPLRPAGLPLLHSRPTRVVRLRSGRRRVSATLATAVEMALDRRGRAAGRPPGPVVTLLATWRGPGAASRPHRPELEPRGVYVSGRLHPHSSSIWASFGQRLVVPPPYHPVLWKGAPRSSPGVPGRRVAEAIAVLVALAALATSIVARGRGRAGGSRA